MALTSTLKSQMLYWAFTSLAISRPPVISMQVKLYSASGFEADNVGVTQRPIAFTVTGGVATNSADISWGTADSWSPITQIVITDGTVLLFTINIDPYVVNTGETITLPAGSIQVAID